jgi:hypothetical protein
MESEERRDRAPETDQGTSAPFADGARQGEFRAWEEVEAGRFLPRRIRGSCRGRALG